MMALVEMREQSNDETERTKSEFSCVTSVVTLNEYRHTSQYLCDVTVVAEGREFPAHRAVLSASGGFFGGLFATSMKEKAENVIHLRGVEADVVDEVLNFVYTGKIEITQYNAQPIIMAADFLLLDALKAVADEFLAKDIEMGSSYDVLSIYRFAICFKCTLSITSASNMVCKKFEFIYESDKFGELGVEILQEIIERDDLEVTSEEAVFKAVVYWVKHEANRNQFFYELFSSVRLCSLTEEFLNSAVLTEELVSSNPDCLSLARERLQKKYVPISITGQHPRNCLDTYINAVVVFPKFNPLGNTPTGPWCYIPFHDKWYHIPIRAEDMSPYGYGLPVYDSGTVYLARNESKPCILLTVVAFNIESNTWSSVTSVPKIVNRFGVACLQGRIYIVGGTTGKTSVGDVYSCDITGNSSKSLKAVASLNQHRGLPCVVSDGTFLYAIGGGICLAEQMSPSKSACTERYDPQSNSWMILSPMKSGRCGAQATIAGGKIFVVGGSAIEMPEYGEVYDINSDTWSQMKSPHCCVVMGALAFCGGKLFLFGCSSQSLEKPEGGVPSVYIQTTKYCLKKKLWATSSPAKIKRKKALDSSLKLPIGCSAVRLLKQDIPFLQPLEDIDP